MPAEDRLFSVRTGRSALLILLIGSGIGLGVNWRRGGSEFEPSRKKHIELERQYFRAAVAKRAAEKDPTGSEGSGQGGSGEGANDPTGNGETASGGSPSTGQDPTNPGSDSGTDADPGGTEAPPISDPPPPPADGVNRLSLADCADLVGSEIAVFVDARDQSDYETSHIPGALHMHHYNSADYIEAARPQLEAAFMIVVYCNGGDCEDSINLAMDLVAVYGMLNENVFVFEGGLEEWLAAGQPITEGANP